LHYRKKRRKNWTKKQVNNRLIFLVKKILEAIRSEELKETEKKQREKENYNELLTEIENKKKREKELLEKEKEFEEKCFRDNEKLSDKKDYSRYMELTNKGNNPNIKYEKLKKESIKESSRGEKEKSISGVSSEASRDKRPEGDETLLKKIQEINL
jgi:hypothetical protein